MILFTVFLFSKEFAKFFNRSSAAILISFTCNLDTG